MEEGKKRVKPAPCQHSRRRITRLHHSMDPNMDHNMDTSRGGCGCKVSENSTIHPIEQKAV